MNHDPSSDLAGPGVSSAGAAAAPDADREPAALGREIAALNAQLAERNTRWSALYQTAILFAQRVYSGDILAQVVRHSLDLLQAQQGVLMEFDPVAGDLVARVSLAAAGPPPVRPGLRVKSGEGITGLVLQTGQAQIVDAYHRWPGRVAAVRSEQIRAALAVPLVGRRSILGVLGVAVEAEARRFSDDDLQTLTLFAQQAAAVLEAAAGRRLEAELLVRNERRRLAQELHDGAQQRLAALLLKVDAGQAAWGDANPAVFAGLEGIALDIQALLREIRATVHALYDFELGGRSLVDTLSALVERRIAETGLRIHLELPSLPAGCLAPQSDAVLLRFVREALTNTYKHARATEVTVRLECQTGAAVRLSVRDNGRGVAVAGLWRDGRAGFGLLSLREQFEALGGRLGLESAPDQGTTVWAVLPVVEEENANSRHDRG
jgi:signal transduction histidine kinase